MRRRSRIEKGLETSVIRVSNPLSMVWEIKIAIVDLFDVTDEASNGDGHLIHCQPVAMQVNRYSDP